MNQKQYNPAIDILRFIAILAVVLIHTTTRTIEAVHLDVSLIPWTLFLNQSARFAVPLFFMISGFVLEISNSSKTNYFQYLQKRLSRIFIPYVFWSTIYYYLVYTKHNISFLHALTLGSSSYQLYFIPTILIFYIFFPVVSKFYNLFANIWVIILLGIIQIAILSTDYYIHPLTYQYPISIALLNFYVFLLGIIASKHQDYLINFVKKRKLLIILVSILISGYIFWEGYGSYIKTHNYYVFYSQWRPSVLLYTIALGSTLYYVFSKNQFRMKIIKEISKLSFFVFFVHVIVLEFIWYSFGIHIYNKQPWFDGALFLSVASISFLVGHVVRRIPYLSKLTG